jgi:flagellar hook protein FlgE
MGIFGAMQTAVSGLRAQSYALENISGNIANSQTTGFKRVDTSFVDLVPDLPYRREIAGSVGAFSRLTNTIQGALETTGVNTHMSINGEGYFMVQERVGFSNNKPVFGGSNLYTRRGDFSLDKDGYLSNGAGYYLRGSSINPVTGQVSGNVDGVIQIPSTPLPANKTDEIQYQAILPVLPNTDSSTAAGAIPTPATRLLQPASGFTANPITTGTVLAEDSSLFRSRTIRGGELSVYNDVGATVGLQIRWGKVANADPAALPTPVKDTWAMYYLADSAATTGQVAWRRAGGDVTFNPNGSLNAPLSITIPSLTLDNTSFGSVKMNFGSSGLSQYASSNDFQQSLIQQDGYGSGNLDSISITNDGRIAGNYSNGQVVAVAQIGIAQFNADNALKRRDGGVYEQTLESGIPLIGLNGATVLGGTLEGSNTEIAEEFSKMIVTQQAYSANTRVVSTSQQMLSEVINIIR